MLLLLSRQKLERQAYDLGVLRLKEYVHEKSGCQVIVQDDPSGRTVIQLSGTDAECQRAQQMIPQLLQNSSLSDDRQLAFPPANLQLPAAKKFGNEITMDVNLAVPPRSMQLPKKQPQPAEEHTPFPPRNLQLPVREEKEDVAGREEVVAVCVLLSFSVRSNHPICSECQPGNTGTPLKITLSTHQKKSTRWFHHRTFSDW